MAPRLPPINKWVEMVDASFDLHRVSARHEVSPLVLDALRYNSEIQSWGDITDHLVVELSSYVLGLEGKHLPHQTTQIFVPASWWQHFKRDCFPAWARNRWPVKCTALPFVTVLREYRVCPHGNYRFDHSQGKVHFSWLKED